LILIQKTCIAPIWHFLSKLTARPKASGLLAFVILLRIPVTTIQKTVDIPLDHRIHLDLSIPKDIPVGLAEIHVTIIPNLKNKQERKPFDGLDGCLKDSAIFGRDALDLQREMRDEWQVFVRHQCNRVLSPRATRMSLFDKQHKYDRTHHERDHQN
jgi:hypothetical protein